MSKFLKSAILVGALTLAAAPALADKFGLGRTALPEEIAAWDLDVRPNGKGLPEGAGDAIKGEDIFAAKCASCHGDFAEGIDNWPKLAGGADTLDHEDPLKTVGSYWPYLSTGYDYIKRSMPYGDAGTLTDDEVYSILAYILYSNDLIEDDFVLSKKTFLDVKMPNADGFIIDDRAKTEYSKWTGEPCMTNCKTEVKITMRAMVLDVTPQEESAAKPAVQTAATEEAKPAVVEETKPAVVAASFDAELAVKGKKVFKKCAACHKVGEGAKNKVGPILNAIVGKPAGAVEGFKYSKALKTMAEDGLVWNEKELIAFLAKPRKFMKGTKMSFAGLKKEADQTALIEYLKSIGE